MTTVHSQSYLRSILDWQIGTTFPAAPSSLWIALLTSMPTDDTGTGMVEATGVNYARVQITSADWGADSTTGSTTEQSVTNQTINMGTPGTGAWGSIAGYAFCYDSSTSINGAGTEAHWMTAQTLTGGNQATSSGVPVEFQAGNLVRQAA